MNMCENGVIRPMSPEEIAELNRWQAEVPESEPTPDDRIAELEAQNQVLTECLMEMSQIVYSERMVFMMAMLWAQQIMLGKKTFADVPRLLKDKVKEILMDSGMEKLVTL